MRDISTTRQLPCGLKRIGLMADSHGNLQVMNNCIKRFKTSQVDAIIHLGDFFDSQFSKDYLRIVDTIQSNHIFAVKGNNDYQVERALTNGASQFMSQNEQKKMHSFLTLLPMILVTRNICFAHSHPYESIRSFYEPIDTGGIDRANLLFAHTIYHIMFSGHSHFPVLFRYRSGNVTREIINPKKPTYFQRDERFIIIVGSAAERESGLLDIEQMCYERIQL